MNAGTRLMNRMTVATTLALMLPAFTGCSSSCGSRGGGCCGGGSPGPAAAVSPLASGPVESLPVAQAVPSGERPYGGQKTCPVTGEELGSMGTPIPVTVKGQTVYVCCRGCVAKLQRDPDSYLAKVMAERAARQ